MLSTQFLKEASMAITLTTQQSPSFASKLYHYQLELHQKSSQDPSLNGLVNNHLIGRVISLGAAFLLHSEAVNKLALICFLSIQKIFSTSQSSLLNTETEKFAGAFKESLQSFAAVFCRQILESQKLQSDPLINQDPKKNPVPTQSNVDSSPCSVVPLRKSSQQKEPAPSLPQPTANRIHTIKALNITEDHFSAPQPQSPGDFVAISPQSRTAPTSPQLPQQQNQQTNSPLSFELVSSQPQSPGDFVAISPQSRTALTSPQLPQQQNQQTNSPLSFHLVSPQPQSPGDSVAISPQSRTAPTSPQLPQQQNQQTNSPLSFDLVSSQPQSPGDFVAISPQSRTAPTSPQLPQQQNQQTNSPLSFHLVSPPLLPTDDTDSLFIQLLDPQEETEPASASSTKKSKQRMNHENWAVQ